MAWGYNNDGQTTIPAAALSGVTAIAGNFGNTIALKDGAVLVWGGRGFGQRTIPTGAQSGVTAIASGANHIITLKGGQVICWGDNHNGQCLGTDRNNVRLIGWGVPGVRKGSPVRIRGTTLTGVTAIAGGSDHTTALTNTGAVLAWGGTNVRDIPASANSGVSAIACGHYHTIALKGGAVLAWGSNWQGQLLIPPSANSGVSAIAGGTGHTIALKDGVVLAWGLNNYGQCTIPTAALSGVTAIAGGRDHTIALKNGAVLAWGANQAGQCNIPASANSGVSHIAAGSGHTIALRVPAPTITLVTPADGQLAGGTTITIRGTNFVTGATSVRVGGNLATSVTVTSPTSLTAITPPGLVAGSVSGDVTTLGGTSSRTNAFTYESPLCPADLNGDGVVNSLDTMIVMIAFGNCPGSPASCPADLNADGVVNAADVTIVVNAYGDC